MNSVFGCLTELNAIHLVFTNLPVYHGGHHFIFIREELVDRLLGDAQLRCYFIHGNRPDPIAHEQIRCLTQYSFFNFHDIYAPYSLNLAQNYGNFFCHPSFQHDFLTTPVNYPASQSSRRAGSRLRIRDSHRTTWTRINHWFSQRFVSFCLGWKRLVIFTPNNQSMKFPKIPRKLFQFFLQGVIILAPISITIWTVASLFNWIDGILP